MDDRQLAAAVVDKWARSPWAFVRDACRTLDEADGGNGFHPLEEVSEVGLVLPALTTPSQVSIP